MSGSCDGCGGVCGECYCAEMAEQDAAYARFALHPLRPWTQALFYMCKALGPPMDIEFRHRVSNGWSRTETRIGATDATPLWWEWHDAAQKWVSR